MKDLGFGVYVHWPYCAAKCPYCDFNSHVRERFEEKRWSQAIVSELQAAAELQRPERPTVTSIFFGGGTPSLMSGQAVGAVLEGIAKLWRVDPRVEVTLEANPNSVEQGRFTEYRAAGVNRVSIGVQAFEDAALKALGRLHGADEAKNAVRTALAVFPRVSFDLIYARPGQTLPEWESELAQALDYGTEHLSVYQLTIEPGTAYATLARQGKLRLPDEDLAADFFEATAQMCAAAGLPAYEISNHSRPGAECRHNLLYWRYGDYAGVGPGAHGRLTLSGRRTATVAERLPERWLSRIEEGGTSATLMDVPDSDAAHEHLLMSMRLAEGLDLLDVQERWGVALDEHRIAPLVDAGLVTLRDDRLAATSRGRIVLNTLIGQLAEALQPALAGA